MEFTPKTVKFKAKGLGARGMHEYKFEIHFYGFIDDEVSGETLSKTKAESVFNAIFFFLGVNI